jgi:hypothetical protein
MTDKIPTDIVTARAAYVELGKALETGEFSPPEAHHWKYRAADAMKRFMGALGWEVGGADPRVQELQKALREACEYAHHFADVAGHPDDEVAVAALAKVDQLAKLAAEDSP